jgi:hypothetical protein
MVVVMLAGWVVMEQQAAYLAPVLLTLAEVVAVERVEEVREAQAGALRVLPAVLHLLEL